MTTQDATTPPVIEDPAPVGEEAATTSDDILSVFASLGLDDPDSERLARLINEVLSGERTVDDIEAALEDYLKSQEDPFDIGSTPITVGDSVIPAGGRLVEVLNPEGSDERSLFRVVYTWNGVEYSYEIGNQERFDELFGESGIQGFSSYSQVDQAEWDESGVLVVGPIDERLGATESEASLMEREFRAMGYEQIPSWWDEEVMTIQIIGAAEGWSASRIAQSISETEAFQERFPALDTFMTGRGINDIVAATSAYVAEENALSAALRRFRGPNTDVSTEYLGTLIGTGWTANEAIPLIEAEKLLRDNPEGLGELNAILAYRGMDLIEADGFIDVMTGSGSADVYEAINDTLRAQALAEAGVDIDTAFAESLGTGTSTTISDPSAFTQAAQSTAAAIARNFQALDLQQFGLERDDIVAAMFGEPSPTGKDAGQINEILGRIEREANASAGGFAGSSSFLDQRGRLRIQGFSNT